LEWDREFEDGNIVFSYYLNDILIYTNTGFIANAPNTARRESYYTLTTLNNLNININPNQQLTLYCKIVINIWLDYYYNSITYTTANFTLNYLE
jgi:hypothetical protein